MGDGRPSTKTHSYLIGIGSNLSQCLFPLFTLLTPTHSSDTDSGQTKRGEYWQLLHKDLVLSPDLLGYFLQSE